MKYPRTSKKANTNGKGSLGDRIRELRQARGFSRDKLAAALGVHKSAVSAWEKGKYAPRPERLSALAIKLGTTPEALRGPATEGAATLIAIHQDLPDILMELTKRTKVLRAFRVAAPYATTAYVQAEWRLLVADRIRSRSLEVQRVEVCYELPRLKEILSNILRFDGFAYYAKCYCFGLREVAPAFGGYIFDAADILLGAYWSSLPPHGKPGLRLSGEPYGSFFQGYWNEIWSRGTWLNMRGAHDLGGVRDLALALGLAAEGWGSFVEEARALEIGDGAPPLV